MANPAHDDNRHVVSTAISGTAVIPIEVDSVTGHLLVEPVDTGDLDPPTIATDISDDNRATALQVVDENGDITPLYVRDIAGSKHLLVDITIE